MVQIISSCTKELQIDIDDNNNLLVVNSVFSPGEQFSFSFSNTAPILGNYDTIMDSFQFILYANKQPIIDTILRSGSFSPGIYPQTLTSYSLEVHSKKHPPLFATDSIPRFVDIDEATIKFPAAIDAYGTPYAEASITFTDPPGEHNYYELLLIENSYDYWMGSGDLKITDPVLLNEGDIDYLPTSYFFSDELIDGQTYTLRIKNTVVWQENGKETTILSKVTAILRATSKNYYMYRKYYTRHVYNQQIQTEFPDIVFKGEPQPMFTNISNGYGIFAGYREDSRELTTVK